MGEETLVETLVGDAINFVKNVDKKYPATFIAWHYYDDADQWRLLYASPLLDPLLQKQEDLAYIKVFEALPSPPPSSLAVSRLKLINTNAPLLQTLRYIARTKADDFCRIHCSDCTVNGIFIKEVIILRSALEQNNPPQKNTKKK